MSGMMDKHEGSSKKTDRSEEIDLVSLLHLYPNIRVKHVLCENLKFTSDQINNPPCNAIHMEMSCHAQT